MKKFKEYLSEEIMPFAQTEKGFVGIDNGPVRDNINLLLANVTAKSYSTPYHALEAVRRVLVSFHISLPATNFLDGDAGQEVFPINQFGSKVGMTNDGQVVTKDASPYYVYFEYELNEAGSFDIFCEIVDESELQSLINDVEEDDPIIPDRDASDTFDDYKGSNAVNEQIVYRGEDKDSYKRRKIMSVLNSRETKHLLPAMQEESLDEVSQKAATTAYAAANDPGYYHPKADKILGHIKRKFGKKAEDDAETHAYTSHFGRGTPKKGKDSLSGGLRQYASDKLTKSGKIPKNTQTAMKNRMDPNKWQGHGRKVGGPKGHLPEEAINEISAGKANDAYHAAKDKMMDNDIMVGLTKGATRKKWLAKSDKRRDQAVKFAQYSDKKKYAARKIDEVLDTPAKKQEYQDKANKSFSDNFGKKDAKAGHTVSKRLAGLRMSLKKEETENLQELSKKTLGSYIKKASHDVATKSAAVGRYADRANKARDKMKKGDYSDWQQGKKDDEFADKMFKKSWKRREGIAKATDKLVKEDEAPFDNPTKTPSTPYKNPAAKSKQLARAAMREVQKGKEERKRLVASLREKPKKK